MGEAEAVPDSGSGAPHFERVLVVEDEPRIRKNIVELFRQRGANVREASSVSGALSRLDPPPDLVIVDVRLPDGSGRAVVEACGLLDPPPAILAMSGMATAREAFELAQLGVDVYVPKPFTRRTLEERLVGLTPGMKTGGTQSDGLSEETTALLSERLTAFAVARGLSQPEQEILRLAISGLPRRRFAEVLGVSENTCKTRIRRLLRKCDAANLAELPRQLLLRAG